MDQAAHRPVRPVFDQAEKSLTLRFFGEETELYQRLLVSAKKRGNTVETEAKIFIEACLDHYGVK